MKKLIFILALLLIATPAWSDIELNLEQLDAWEQEGEEGEPNVFFALGLLSYDVNGSAVPRAWGLELLLDNEEASFDGIWRENEDFELPLTGGGEAYWVSPGTYPDNAPGVGETDDGASLVELASLYPEGDDSPPDVCDLLYLLIIGPNDTEICMDITANAIRGGVIDEAGNPLDIDPNDLCMQTSEPIPPYEPDPNANTCWDNVNECAGQKEGDATCDGSVNLDDLRALKDAFLANKGDANYDCCADFNQDETVNLDDLRVLKDGFLNTGYTPSTGLQDPNCPI